MDIKELLREHNVDGLTMAKQLGMHSNSFYKRTNGKKAFKAKEIREMAEILGVEEKIVLFAALETWKRREEY